MPLPFVAWGVAAGVAGVLIKRSKNKAHQAGVNQGREESKAYIKELTEKLHRLQQEREHVKDQFQSALSGIAQLDLNDKGFFSKMAALVKGHSTFHVYVVGVVSIARSRCLELGLPKPLEGELKAMVLGVIHGGFPEQLKAEIREIWESMDLNAVQLKLVACQKRIPDNLALEFRKAEKEINEAVSGLHEVHRSEAELQQELRRAQAG
jgi:chromosome segregation ATPase